MLTARRWFHLMLVLSTLLLHLPPRLTYAQDSRPTQVVASLRAFARTLSLLGFSPELQRPLPLSYVSPAHPQGLRLSTVFTETLDSLPLAPTSLDELKLALQRIQRRDVGGVSVTLGDVSVAPSQVDPALVDLAFTFDAARTIDVPLAVMQPPLVVTSGSYAADLRLTTRLRLQVDTRAGTLAVVGEPTIRISMQSQSSLMGGLGRVGFADVELAGDVALNASVEASLADPDRSGRITQDEWLFTALEDLFRVAYADQPGDDVHIVPRVQPRTPGPAPQVPLVADTSAFSLIDDSLADGLLQPVPQLGQLAEFENVTPSQMLSGIQRLTAALGTAHLAGDQKLPFAASRLISTEVLLDPLVSFIRRHGDAAIVCGTEQGSIPPRGDPSNAAPDTTVYCQAITLRPVTAATWLNGEGQFDPLTTVGPNPTATAPVKVPSAGFGAIELTFTDNTGEQHTVQPLFRSASELQSRLQAAGFGTVEMLQDPATSSLTYHLEITPSVAPRPIDIDFGDLLTSTVGLAGLRSGQDGSRPRLTVQNTTIDVTFGVIMLPEGDPRLPSGPTSDRFFLKVRSGQGEYEISADATLGDQMALAGQIGFVEVESMPGQPSLTLDKADPNKPLLALDITAPAGGIQFNDGRNIPDALMLTELLSPTMQVAPPRQTSPYVPLALNASLRGELLLQAQGMPLGTGGLRIEWPDVARGPIVVTPTGDFATTLGRFADFNRANPQLLGDVVLGGIDRLLEQIDSVRGGDIAGKLPIIGYSPRELLGIEQIANELAKVRNQPVRSLQQLAAASHGLIGFSLAPSTAGSNDLIIHLTYNTQGQQQLPLRFALSPDGDIALAGVGQNNVRLGHTVRTDLRLGLPLEPVGDAAAALEKLYVVDASSASATATLDTQEITFNVGSRALQLSATGKLHFAATVALRADDADSDGKIALADLPAHLQVGIGPPAGVGPGNCGNANGLDMTGDVCARLSLSLPALAPITLGFRIEHFTALAPDAKDPLDHPDGWYFSAPGLDQIIADPTQAFNWNQLAGSLPELLRLLTDTLKAGEAVPLVGKNLQAGADVVNAIDQSVVTPLSDLQTKLNGCATVGAIEDAVTALLLGQQPVCGQTIAAMSPDAQGVTPAGLIDTINVTIYCGEPVECDDSLAKDAAAITDIRVNMTLGENGVDKDIPFDLGIDGVPFDIKGGLKSTVTWSFPLVFGLSREHGPYIGDQTYTPALTVDATLSLKEGAASEPPAPSVPDSHPLHGFTSKPVLTGRLGFLTVNLYDRAATPTQLTLGVGISGDRVIDHLPVERLNEINLTFREPTGSLNIDLLLRAGLADNAADDSFAGNLPAVLATITVPQTSITDLSLPPADQIFGNLHVDVSKFKDEFIDPIADKIDAVTSPMRPVIDTLSAPLPGISDLSRMTGGDDVTLLDMVKLRPEFNGELIDRLAQVADLADSVSCIGNDLIPLPRPCAAPAQLLSVEARQDMSTLAATADSLPAGLTFPFLASTGQAVNLLLGKDVTLVHFDAGKLRGEGGFSQTFPPIMVGPIPIAIGISASVAVEGHFAMGYDTYGIRQAFANGEVVRLAQGLYIDDLDGSGADVPEVAFVGTVAVSAAIDIGIAAAGIRGGIELTLGLNFRNDLAPGGKLRLSTIGSHLNNPICLFTATGRLSAFLSAFVRIGFSFFSKTFEFRIAEVTLVDFSKDLCANPPKPNLADQVGKDVRLNIGPRAGLRNLPNASDDTDEKFVVRQISAENAYPPGVGGGTRISISAFGVYEEETVLDGGKVYANGGNENDRISLEAGVDLQTKQPITFTVASELEGGLGDDELNGGDGIDRLMGGDHNDTLSGGDGGDTLLGGAGDDVLDGSFGDDPQLDGDADNDVVIGGPGRDTINGGDGNDRLSGGPGSNQLGSLLQNGTVVTRTAAIAGPAPDLDDMIKGGWGDDLIDGGFGDDTLFGNGTSDEQCDSAAPPDPGQTDRDIIQGGFDNDSLFGGPDVDYLAGQDGDDRLCGNGGDDSIDGDGEGTRMGSPVFSSDGRLTGEGHDTLDGGAQNDTLRGQGGDDDLFGRADNDFLFGEDGGDDLSGGLGIDRLEGGPGRDYLFGDDGSAVRPAGQGDATSVSFSEDLGDGDSLSGGGDDDVLYGEGGGDTMNGDAGQDRLFGNGGNDIMRGDTENDIMEGNADDDEMHGDSGDDRMWGNDGADTMRGGIGDDYAEGNQGVDTIFGDADQDDLIGGTSTVGTADVDDTIDGGAQHDFLAGDNAQITRPGGVTSFDGAAIRVITLLDIDSPDLTVAAGDHMFGGDGNDRMWGQGGGDMMRGGANDDFMQGNAATDAIYGDTGQD